MSGSKSGAASSAMSDEDGSSEPSGGLMDMVLSAAESAAMSGSDEPSESSE